MLDALVDITTQTGLDTSVVVSGKDKNEIISKLKFAKRFEIVFIDDYEDTVTYHLKEIGKNLRKRRKELGLLGKEVATIVGMSEGSVFNIEHGRKSGINLILTIAKFYNVTLDELIYGGH